MPNFAETLQQLPGVEHIEKLELCDNNNVVGVIENKPGQAGSLAVYHRIATPLEHIDATAAQQGLVLYAEHTADAKANPGKHPNIDRLLDLIAAQKTLTIRAIPKSA